MRLELLKAEPGAGLPERHRTLRAAIEWSYDLLGAEEQALFTSLGVFVGGFTLDGAKAVAGDLELDVVAGVESLLNNSLLRTEPMAAGEPRFGMLETIREYASSGWPSAATSKAVRRRHAGFYLPLAEEAEPALLGPQQLSWLERLDAERDNLRAALTLGRRRRRGRGRPADRRRALALLADARLRRRRAASISSGCSPAAPARRRSAPSRNRGLPASPTTQGDHDAVHRYVEASLPVHRELGDDWNLSCDLSVLTMSALAEGDADRGACSGRGSAGTGAAGGAIQ